MDREYYLGLDIGTDSVGWAVTDKEYKLKKIKGKELWGVRLFDGAKTAAERRIFRGNRRRLERKKQRIQLLEELFAEEIVKIDEAFFIRMKESYLFTEDKTIKQPFSLFADKDYTDKQYHKAYPTIYHLRKDLMEDKAPHDIRLLYIALHHIIKNRGHFIFEGNVESVTSFNSVYEQFTNILKDEFDIEIDTLSSDALSTILKDKNLKKRDKQDKLAKLLNISKKDKQEMCILGAIVGLTVKLSELFCDNALDELERKTICFSDASYEDSYTGLEESMPEKCYIIEVLKMVYDWAILADLLKDDESLDGTATYLSYAKVNQYEKHKKDLSCLKDMLKYIGDKEYKQMFSDSTIKDNYCAYVGFTKNNNKKESVKCCKKEDFYKNISALIKNFEDTELPEEIIAMITYVKAEISKDNFLPLQVSKNNGVIPHQIHLVELEKILKLAGEHHNFLNDKDEDGITVSEKIKQLFLFRVPYYVGPLNDAHKDKGSNCWFVRKGKLPIRPWNIDNIVDMDASAEEFIERMKNKCTYLIGEDVLPKNSLLYTEFTVLNELNNIKVKGELLTVEIKQLALEKLFKKERSVTKNKLFKFLKSEAYELKLEDITGIDEKFLSSLAPYHDFKKKVFKENIDQYKYALIAEDIIRYCTLYGDDKKMVTRVLKKTYPNELTDEQLKAIRGLRYAGWGRLSKKLLSEVEGTFYETGECFSIINALRKTQHNLMQLLSSQYTFINEIENTNKRLQGIITEISYNSIVKNLPISPSVKRVTWQTVQIVQEVKKVLGQEPKKVFIEVAKGPQEKIKTMSRKDQLIKLYKNCKEEERDWKKELETKTESDFRSIKLYLYYTQKGRCMYTQEAIALSELANVNIYDKDHIYPRSKTKDDSLDNLVLVKKVENSHKDNDMLSPEIQHKMLPFWQNLRKSELISQEKYNRLTRKTELTPEELAGFINRQLVETRQSSKAVANIIKQICPESDVVYVKAKLVSEFRQEELKIVKSRTMNDLHHAKDAYLNIVVGNVYHTKFTSNPLLWLKSNVTPKYSLNKMFQMDLVKNKEYVWKRGDNGTKSVVKSVVKKNNIIYTRYATCNKGEFFNQQIVSPKDNPTVPIKKGLDMSKYGGYKSVVPAYFALVESFDKKGKLQRTIESVPLYLEKEFKEYPEKFLFYCEKNYELKSPRVILPCIKKNSLFKINGFLMHLRGTTGIQLIFQGAVQLCMNQEQEEYIKKIEKYLAQNAERKDKKNNLPLTEHDKVTQKSNVELYEAFIKKHSETIYKNKPANLVGTLKDKREAFEKLCVEQQCIVLGEILHVFQCKPITADLSLLGGGKTLGKIQTTKRISGLGQVYIIHQSITGLYVQTPIDLLNI